MRGTSDPARHPVHDRDIIASLEALDPARVWHKRAIVSHICRLREIGLIRRLEKATIHNPAKYVRAESPMKAAPVSEMSMEQVIDAVLNRPMTSTEVVVAVREYGYKSKMTRINFRTHCVDILRRGKAKYSNDGGKWVRK